MDAWKVLGEGPAHMDHDTQTPIRVWVVDHAAFAYTALEIKPFMDFTGLVWALVEASCVSRSGSGISVSFSKRLGVGWFPRQNVSFKDPGESRNLNVV